MAASTVRLEGVLTSWDDERGFGFISPAQGGQRVFVHITGFPPGPERPQIGDALSFGVEHTADGKSRASAVRYSRRAPSRRRGRTNPRIKWGLWEVLVIVAFAALIIVVEAERGLPLWLVALYVVASIVSFTAYAVDKSAATAGQWRISESTLLVLGVIGGWPGAIIAQQTLRHKTKKMSFRIAFWGTVAVNIAVFVLISVFALT